MMQIYILEDVCKKLYAKVVFRNYNFVEKIVEKKSFQKGKLPCCPKSRATNPPNARALISWPLTLILQYFVQSFCALLLFLCTKADSHGVCRQMHSSTTSQAKQALTSHNLK